MSLYQEQKKFKLGYWAGLIGGILLTLTGVIGLINFRGFLGVYDIYLIPQILTLIWGIIALFGAALLYNNNIVGDYLLIASGSLAIFGMFFPLFTHDLGSTVYIGYLSYHFGYIDPFLVLIGGIIDLLVRKEIIWT